MEHYLNDVVVKELTIICVAPGHIALYTTVTHLVSVTWGNIRHTFQGQVRSGTTRSGQVR